MADDVLTGRKGVLLIAVAVAIVLLLALIASQNVSLPA